LSALADAGVNRLSIGVQALDDHALSDLGRWHSAADARAAVERALSVFDRVSIDLISMRPGQTLHAWRAEIGEAASWGVEHLSIYELTIEPGTAFERRARRGELPAADDERGAAFFEATNEACTAAGFDAYEISNHARGPAARSAHNLIYWRSGEWVGVGPGAHGRLGPLGGARIATAAARSPTDYIAAVEASGWSVAEEEELDGQAQLEETLLMGLRLAEGVPLARLEQIESAKISPNALERLERDGFLTRSEGRLAATKEGRPLIDRIVLELIDDR
jgi:oxygen-independent coproporphyrinogen-3 oxidase